MTSEEKRKKLETLPWQALFDAAIQKEVEDSKLNGTPRYLERISGKKVMFIGLDKVCRLLEENDSISVP